MVTQLPEEADEHSVTMRQLLAKLDVAMGGRVAEEIIFGESDVTTGASSDLEQASPCQHPVVALSLAFILVDAGRMNCLSPGIQRSG